MKTPDARDGLSESWGAIEKKENKNSGIKLQKSSFKLYYLQLLRQIIGAFYAFTLVKFILHKILLRYITYFIKYSN
jgi:hypothetical protein